MKLLVFFLFSSFTMFTFAQNVGQTGDTLINYTDINGNKQGFWQQKYYNGKLKYEGYFRNNKPIGEFKRYDNRERLTSKLFYSELGDTAYAEMYHENGKNAAVGRYINKIKDGEWKYFDEEGRLINLETLKMEVKHGAFKTFYLDGKVYEEKNYEDGQLHGENKRHYSNGQMNYKSNYIRGKRVGDFFVYNIDGKVLVYGKYVDDKRHGTWRFYEENGMLLTEINYEYGIPDNKEALEIQETEKLKDLEDNKNMMDDPEDFLKSPEQFIFMKREKNK